MGHDVLASGAENTPTEIVRRKALEAAGVRIIAGKLDDEHWLHGLVRDADVVIHLAAAQHEVGVPDGYFRAVNVEGTRNLLAACRAESVPRFVHGSTIGVYGSALEGELTEASPTMPNNIYGVTKLEAEGVVHSFEKDLACTIVRISETYGPGDRRLLKLFRALNSGTFFVVGRGRNIHQPVYVDDLTTGLLSAATSDGSVGETFVLAGAERLTTTQMVEQIAAALDSRAPSLRLPLWPFYATALLMEAALKPLGIEPPLHRRRLDFFVKSFSFSQEKASRLLGYSPRTSFRAGTAATAAWYHDQGLLSLQRHELPHGS